ncbi:DNA topoisomerase VI subunit B [Candidatus Thorarchaeota archaeon]|nr:MAG: DNA topoisomerase VI subunit B [Candidatus Thorarchaeota archaeon]
MVLDISETKQDIVELSVSAWFYRNRAIAGFDNPARSLYVSVRELLENSLDASEEVGVLPEIRVSLSYVGKQDDSTGIPSTPRIFKLTVSDNGGGIESDDIPKLIGKMLTGTKFVLKQSRGTFGLGGSLALLYGQITTQKPITVESAIKGNPYRNVLTMKLDIEKNEPVILGSRKLPKRSEEHGTTVSYFLQGDWFRSKRRIQEYFNQTSLIVPYASIEFDTPDGEILSYPRIIDVLPDAATEMKPHPKGIDVEMLKSMIASTKSKNIETFLINSFQRVGPATADSFLKFAGVESNMPPEDLNDDDLVNLMERISAFEDFYAPSADCLSPAQADVMRAGMKRLHPEYVSLATRNPNSYEGHPFIIETGIAYGGQLQRSLELYRFANRIPLLYDESADVSSRVLRELNLSHYGLSNDDPLAFFIHICSTKIPYKTVGKEYIADVDIVRREIELGFKDCLRSIATKVRNKNRVRKRKKRENKLALYYGFIANTLSDSLGREIQPKLGLSKEVY